MSRARRSLRNRGASRSRRTLGAFVIVVGMLFSSAAMASSSPSSSSHKKKKQSKNLNNLDLDCDSKSYQKSTLTLLSSQKFAAIPGYLRSGHMRQFEGSGVSIGPSGQVAVVFDNSHALGLIGSESATSPAGSPLSIGVGELVGDRGGSQSGWEGVAWRDDADGPRGSGAPATVLALREAVEVPIEAAAAAAAVGDEANDDVGEKEKEEAGKLGVDDWSFLGWAPRGFSSVPGGNASSSSSSVDVKKRVHKKGKKDKKKKKKRPEGGGDDGDGDETALFAVVDELALPTIAGEPAKLLRSCPVDFELTHDNKGLEDLYYLGNGRAIALCEGNYCEGGKRGREPGNGRLLVLRYDDGSGSEGGEGEVEEEEEEAEDKGLRRRRPRRGNVVFVGGQRAADAAATARSASGGGGGGGGPRPVVAGAAVASSSPSSPSSPRRQRHRPLFAARCAWRVESVVDLPRDAEFEDYSGLALRSGLMAVLSQMDSAVFVAGFDVGTLVFDPIPQDKRYKRRVFALPRSNTCQAHSFCTAEGIDLLDDPLVRGVVRVLIATDKAAAGSPWACVHTAEAIHVMSLPKHALPQAPDREAENDDENDDDDDDDDDDNNNEDEE